MSLIDQGIVLRINALWMPIGWTNPKEAFIAMSGKPGGTPPSLALDITLDEKGDLISAIPTKWNDWINLPVRENVDRGVSTAFKAIRCPMVIMEPLYRDLCSKAPKLTTAGILERDRMEDQYTGEKLTRESATVDHVISKDMWRRLGLKGSPNTWTNMVACEKKRNHLKGNKSVRDAGLVLKRKPKQPRAVPVSYLLKGPRHPQHAPFFSK